MGLNDALLPEFDQEMGHPRRSLERIPGARVAWAPHRKSMTLGCPAPHLMNHAVHHRAQFGACPRLGEVPVPAIFGPSADEGSL